MIAYLRGTLAVKASSHAVVDVNGVGYAVSMSQAALSKLPALGDDVQIQTYLQVSDSGAVLYGFLNDDEKTMFEKLIAVSGVGPKMALAALSTFSPSDLAKAVAAQDATLISKVPGVGKKTASRIIIDLKGSLDDVAAGLFGAGDDAPSVDDVPEAAGLSGATEALLSMGFTPAEAELALKGAPEGATEQALLQYALKRLGS